MKTKVCKDCKKRRLVNKFYIDKKGYYCSYCKDCHKLRRQANWPSWHKENSEAYALAQAKAKAKRNGYLPPKISVAELKVRRAASNGICDIAGCDKPWRVRDHDHITGQFRGFLCKSHNVAFGAFGDSIFGMLKGIDYLKGRKQRA